MERVTGIGGMFFRAQDPGALARWYAEHPGRPQQAWKLNFRVRNLDAMIAQLRRAGIQVTPDPGAYPNGRFATTSDSKGNPIELWEPTPDELQEPSDRRS